jgi:hypothetical protein
MVHMRLQTCRRILFLTLCVAVLAFSTMPAAVADPVFTVEPSATLKALRLIIFGGGEIDDVRGAALVDVSNPGPVGQISILDPTGGVPVPTFLTLAFGNTVLDGANSTFTEETQVVLNMASQIVTPTTLSLFGTGIAVGAVTDAALAATIGNLEFDFGLFNITTDPNTGDVLATYQFSSMETVPSPVPEPRSWILLFVAFAGCALAIRYRRRGIQN